MTATTWADYSAGMTWDDPVLTPPAELADKLAAHLQVSRGDFVDAQVVEAMGLLNRLLSGADQTMIPVAVLDRAVVEVAADLYHRRAAKNGIATYGDGLDVPPMRIRRDPLDAARPILFHWLPGGFA